MGAVPSGRNTNRTTLTDNTVTTTYCYDWADRLTTTTDPTLAAPAYDTHGNVTFAACLRRAWLGAQDPAQCPAYLRRGSFE